MKHEKLIVNTQSNGKQKNIIWDTAEPIPLGFPFRWVLERTSTGIRVRDLRGKTGELQKRPFVHFDFDPFHGKENLELDDMVLSLRSMKNLRPAYRSSHDISVKDLQSKSKNKILELPQLIAFAGTRKTILSSQAVHTAYVAYVRNKPVLIVNNKEDKVEVKPLLDHVFLKLKGDEPVLGEPGKSWTLNRQQLLTAVLIRGSHWWRFNFIRMVDVGQMADDMLHIDDQVDEAEWFKKATKIAAILVFLFLLLVWLWPTAHIEQPLPKKITPPPVVKFAKSKNTKPPSGDPQGQSSETPPPPAPTMEQKPVVALPVKPQVVAKPVAPPKQQPPQKVAVAPPVPDKQQKVLIDALSKAAALAQKVVAINQTDTKVKPQNGDLIMNSKATKMGSSVQVAPTYTGNSTSQIGVIGSQGKSGKGVSYGTGEKAIPAGSASSFVSLDTAGSTVDEGLTREEVAAVIHSHMEEIRYCHEAAALINPKAEGKVVLQFRIVRSGQVATVSPQSSTITEPGLEKCIIRRLKTWAFPQPRGGVSVNVSYPFLFKVLGRKG